MVDDPFYRQAEERTEAARKSGATSLALNGIWHDAPRHSRKLPDSLGQLTQLQALDLSRNGLIALPEGLGRLTQLQRLNLEDNELETLPEGLSQLAQLQSLNLSDNSLTTLEDEFVLNEAKLILVGEGEVGKSCLLAALRGDAWIEGRTTAHGIEIKPVEVTDPDRGARITLNGWDFGGQPVYRPTHQLFFSAPAVYLVVWKPREGPQQGFVKEWIKLVKHRAPDAKILVVATHGGPQERQPDIDRQEIWDLFGQETVIDFFHVDSQPPHKDAATGGRSGECAGIAALKDAIARVAASLPDTCRRVPQSWQQARTTL